MADPTHILPDEQLSDEQAAPAQKNHLLSEIVLLEKQLASLRRELVNSETAASTLDLLVFRVCNKPFAVFLNDIVEVLRMVQYAPLPHAPPDIQGVINCRGIVLPLLNPGLLLTDRPVTPGIQASIVVVTTSGHHIAVLVDGVDGVESFTNSDREPADAVHHTMPPYISGFLKTESRHITIVDVNQLLSSEHEKMLGKALRDRDAWGEA